MRKQIKRLNNGIIVFQDTETGVALAEEEKTGRLWGAHEVVNVSSIPADLIRLKHWGEKDRIVRVEDAFINLDRLDNDAPFSRMISQLCRCVYPYHHKNF